jgi:RNA polymerase sigma factor for flagellar operon FliA
MESQALTAADSIHAYLPLVRRVAKKIARRTPASVSLDELVSAGTLGLVQAMQRKDAAREDRFVAYAIMRIRGAILDELRSLDSLTRAERARVRRGEATASTSTISIEDASPHGADGFANEDVVSMDAALERRDQVRRLKQAIAALPARERQILFMHQVDGRTLKDIGGELGVSEGRICQLHTRAMARLREMLLQDEIAPLRQAA